MKKIITVLTIGVALLTQIHCLAQGFYIECNGGYGFAADVQSYNDLVKNGSYSATYTYTTGQPSPVTTYTTATNISNSYSLGSGTSIGINIGYMITKNVGFEIEAADKFSSSVVSTYNFSELLFTPPSTSGNINSTYVNTFSSGNIITFTPAIRLIAGKKKLKPYLVAGLILGLPPSPTLSTPSTTTYSNINVSDPNENIDEIFTFSGGMMLGFHGALGLNDMLSNKIGISGEAFVNLLNWAPKKELVTTLTYNGVDSLPYKSTNFKETDFVSSATTSSNTSQGSPYQAPYMYLPFSSFGIKISFHYYFGSGSAGAAALTAAPK